MKSDWAAGAPELGNATAPYRPSAGNDTGIEIMSNNGNDKLHAHDKAFGLSRALKNRAIFAAAS
jgi:hypothetical protein